MAFYKQDIVDINLNTGSIFRSFLNHSIGFKNDDADRFGIRCFRDGEPVDLSGASCQAVFMAPNGVNIALTSYGTVSGNVAYVTLPPACYDYEGQFCLSIQLVGGGVTGTMRIVDGMVVNTGASGAVAPTASVPTYQEIIAQYDAMVAATSAANLAIAETFDATNAYPAGKYVINEGHLYRLTADHAANVTWANTSKVATNFGDDLTALKSAITSYYHKFFSFVEKYHNERISYKCVSATETWKGTTQANFLVSAGDVVHVFANNHNTAGNSVCSIYFYDTNGNTTGSKTYGPSDITTNEVNVQMTAPANTVRCAFNFYCISSGGSPSVGTEYFWEAVLIYVGSIELKNDIIVSQGNMDSALNEKIENIAKLDTLVKDGKTLADGFAQFESGTIYMEDNGNFPRYSDANSRRTIYAVSLKAGDVIGLSDYTNARISIGWGDEHKRASGWITQDFTLYTDGNYQIVINKTGDGITADDLVGLFFVKRTKDSKNKADKNGIDIVNDDHSIRDVQLDNGYVYISTSGWSYSESNLAYNARFREGYSVHLEPMDIIEIDYLDIVMICGVLDDYSETYGVSSTGWSKRCIATLQGNYCISFKRSGGGTISKQQISEIWKNLKIIRRGAGEKAVGKTLSKNLPIATYAHRGMDTVAPENTIPAFEMASKYGYRGVEIDIKFSSDGVPVVIHDGTVNRTSNGEGNVSDFTLAELKALDFGSWFNEKFTGTTIPTLDETCAFCKKNGIRIMLDLNGRTDHEEIDTIFSVISANDMLPNTVWANWYGDALDYVHALDPLADLFLTCNRAELAANLTTYISTMAALKGSNNVYIYPETIALTDAQREELVSSGVGMSVWNYKEVITLDKLTSVVTSGGIPAWVYQYDWDIVQ